MVKTRFLISAEFWGATLIRGMCLLDGCAYADQIVSGVVFIRGWYLFQAWCFLDEYGIAYFSFIKFELQ